MCMLNKFKESTCCCLNRQLCDLFGLMGKYDMDGHYSKFVFPSTCMGALQSPPQMSSVSLTSSQKEFERSPQEGVLL